MKIDPTILLTFDVEEFDLPLEYNLPISPEVQMEIGRAGTIEIKKLIESHQIATTLFTTANFADHFPALIRDLSIYNEIASHTYYHSKFEKADLLQSKNRLEEITGVTVNGLRMPRFKKIDSSWVKEAGYKYDSSVNPTYIPGRYNNLHVSRTVYRENGFTILPVSVSTKMRFPLFWMAFKNIPYPIYKKMALDVLKKDGYLSLYFHPWEFTAISQWKVPFYLKKLSGNELIDRWDRLINDLKKEGEFKTVSSFLNKTHNL